jgi:phosphate uptake regulator
MFRELLGLFGPQDRYAETHGAFVETFRVASEVFSIAHEAVWSGDVTDATNKRLRARDAVVNARERELRKTLVRHLSVQQGLDILFCLRLMSLVKDVERIGDYGKNLFEVGELRQGEFDASETRDQLKALGDEVNAYIKGAIAIFEASDESAAVTAVAEGRALAERGEALVELAVRHQGSPNSAACFALMARHYKRSASHAMNVLTGLTMPIHALDYFDEDR